MILGLVLRVLNTVGVRRTSITPEAEKRRKGYDSCFGAESAERG